MVIQSSATIKNCDLFLNEKSTMNPVTPVRYIVYQQERISRCCPSYASCINFLCLCLKYYIYSCRFQGKELIFEAFVSMVKFKQKIEYKIAQKKNKLQVHFKKWSIKFNWNLGVVLQSSVVINIFIGFLKRKLALWESMWVWVCVCVRVYGCMSACLFCSFKMILYFILLLLLC